MLLPAVHQGSVTEITEFSGIFSLLQRSEQVKNVFLFCIASQELCPHACGTSCFLHAVGIALSQRKTFNLMPGEKNQCRKAF